jgi:hypothetical protein
VTHDPFLSSIHSKSLRLRGEHFYISFYISFYSILKRRRRNVLSCVSKIYVEVSLRKKKKMGFASPPGIPRRGSNLLKLECVLIQSPNTQ